MRNLEKAATLHSITMKKETKIEIVKAIRDSKETATGIANRFDGETFDAQKGYTEKAFQKLRKQIRLVMKMTDEEIFDWVKIPKTEIKMAGKTANKKEMEALKLRLLLENALHPTAKTKKKILQAKRMLFLQGK
mgnify:CR=1 FL=1